MSDLDADYEWWAARVPKDWKIVGFSFRNTAQVIAPSRRGYSIDRRWIEDFAGVTFPPLPPEMNKPTAFAVYVPSNGGKNASLHGIKKGSAIVGEIGAHLGEGLEIHYEGNLYNAVNLQTFEEKALCAAGRLRERYPTAAVCFVPSSAVICVGTFDYETRRLNITDRASFDAWVS